MMSLFEELYALCCEHSLEAEKQFEEKLRALEGSLLNELHPYDGWTLLMNASYCGNLPMVRLLLYSAADLKNIRREIDIFKRSVSGQTAIDVCVNEEVLQLLTGEKQRRMRLLSGEKKIGYHETSLESFSFILEDSKKGKYPMIGGNGGYFGGGVYFALSQAESSIKALHHDRGLKVILRMGHCFKIESFDELDAFRQEFCGNAPYQTPVDVVQARLLEKGYDSVWGHHRLDFPEDKRILKTGDELVVYSADQIRLKDYFAIVSPCHFKNIYDRRDNIWIPYKPSQPIVSTPLWRTASLYKLKMTPDKEETCGDISWLRNYLGTDFVSGDLIWYELPNDARVRCAVYFNYSAFEILVNIMEFYSYIHPSHPMTFNEHNPYYRNPPLFLTLQLLDDLGLTTAQELYLHYKDVLREAAGFYPQPSAVYVELMVHRYVSLEHLDKPIFPWGELIFPDYMNHPLFLKLKDHFETNVYVYTTIDHIVFLQYTPNYYVSKPIYVNDIESLFSENRGAFDIRSMLTIGLTKRQQKAILDEYDVAGIAEVA
jgi:hypothetical protein